MSTEELSKKLEKLPEVAKKEVEDFIDFPASKHSKKQKYTNVSKSNFGSVKGLIEMAYDFNEPLEEFKDYQ